MPRNLISANDAVGVFVAARRSAAREAALLIGSVLGASIPTFWLGMMLLYLFAQRWPLFPAASRRVRGAAKLASGEGLAAVPCVLRGGMQSALGKAGWWGPPTTHPKGPDCEGAL